MENSSQRCCFKVNEELDAAASISIIGVSNVLRGHLDKDDPRPKIPLNLGDPSVFSCFRINPSMEDAIVESLRSANFNSYAPSNGILPARRSIAEYLNLDLSYKVSPDDVFLTVGCKQAIDVMISVLSRPGVNILLPRPGYPVYECRAAFNKLEVRHFNLLPERNWEIDLDSVEALADDNTAAMVIINPGNPCGSVFTRQHLEKIAETARKLGIFVISDEVYGHIAFEGNPFVPMGEFAHIAPVITLGSISKRWIVPGWRLGWIVINDLNDKLKNVGIVNNISNYLAIATTPPTFIQGAVPDILEKTKKEYFSKSLNIMKESADMCYNKLKEIPCITCPHKPEGSMFVMVELNLSQLEDISDDYDFCVKLAKEESVLILPGFTVGLKNWLRISFGIEPQLLEDGLDRLKAFYLRHAKKQ